MPVTRGASVRVGRSRHGIGLFAAVDIPVNDVVLIFTGELLELEEVLASGRDECYPLQVGPTTYLDLDARSRVGHRPSGHQNSSHCRKKNNELAPPLRIVMAWEKRQQALSV